jgi:PAS domain S-box-containing protein
LCGWRTIILYLNRLRHSLAEPMSVRLAMDPSLPAVQAIQNINAWGDGVDYRGVPVIFSSQVVPGTPWIMIAKVDRDEVLSGLRWASVAVGLSVFFLLLIAALLLLNRYRRQEYEQLVALSEQERYFHEVLDHSADAMLIVGSDSQIIYANGQAARLFDYRQEALLSMAWDRLLPRGENSSLDEFYQETVSAGQQTREIRMRTRDKRIIPVELNCAACRTSAGACRFATLPNAAACRTNCVRTKPGSVTFPTVRPTGLETDADYCFTWVSDNIYDIVGVPNGLIGRSRLDLLARSTDNPPAQVEAHREVLARRQPFRHFEYRLLTSEGRNLWLSVSGALLQGRWGLCRLSRPGAGGDRAPRERGGAGALPGRAGKPWCANERRNWSGQGGPRRRPPRRALPGQHEPRDSHADERHHRLHPYAV